MNKEIKERIVLSAFAADAFALGVHWIYDIEKLKKISPIETLLSPGEKSFHPTKKKGEFTHYGDQMFVLLESVTEAKAFDAENFSRRWRSLFSDYNGYFDGATKSTLKNLENGKPYFDAGSNSNDLAGASRFAPLFLILGDDVNILAEAAKVQTRLTHNDPDTMDAACFLARTSYLISTGVEPAKAFEETVLKHYEMTPIEMWVEDGLKSVKEDTVSVIQKFGQSCHLPEAMPGVIHLAAKYENDLTRALIENVTSGGDSSARGMAVAMLLGAYEGAKGVKEEWINGIHKINRIRELIGEALG